jgi:hypothetical protein
MERPVEDQPPIEPSEPGDEFDLASIGLAVFFVSMILVVGALLILPAIF